MSVSKIVKYINKKLTSLNSRGLYPFIFKVDGQKCIKISNRNKL